MGRAGRGCARRVVRRSAGVYHRRWSWVAIAQGASRESRRRRWRACRGASASGGFVRVAGWRSVSMGAARSARFSAFAEREEMARLHAEGLGVREIARWLGRAPSTRSRELRRNAATRFGPRGGLPGVGGAVACRAARQAAPRPPKWWATSSCASTCRSAWLATWNRPDGTRGERSAGGRGRGADTAGRQDRRWANGFGARNRSPAGCRSTSRMMSRCGSRTRRSISRCMCRAAARWPRELTACLRTGRALRVPRARTQGRGKGFISEEVMISRRPAEVADRAVPGHWEGDQWRYLRGSRPYGP